MNLNINSALRSAKSLITANSPVLLVSAAVAGTVGTAVLSARAGWQARGIVDAAEVEHGRKLETTEVVKLTWLCYAVPAVTGASTIGSVLGLHVIHNKRQAAMAGLLAMTQTRLDDYREKAEELLGTKKTQQLNDQVAQAGVDRHGEAFDDSEMHLTQGGDYPFYDELSGRQFSSSVNRIDAAINKANAALNAEGDYSLADFYDSIGLQNTRLGDLMGWSGGPIEARYGATQLPSGMAATSLWFHPEPKARRNGTYGG